MRRRMRTTMEEVVEDEGKGGGRRGRGEGRRRREKGEGRRTRGGGG